MEDRYNEGRAGEATGTAARMKEQATEKIDQMKEKAGEMKDRVADASRKATDRIDAQREPAARTLENTAQRIRERGERVSGATSSAVQTTVDKLQATADYIREHDLNAMFEDVQDVVRRHPGPALAAAAVAGFLVARAFTSNHD